jgi:hypothetical protein
MRQYFNISSENNNLNLDLTKFKRLVIYDWSVPFTFFNIYNYNNVFLNSINISETLPFGNYDVNTLKTVLESEIGLGFEITFNTTTYKTTISATNNFDATYNPFLEMLGFTGSLTGSNSYTSPNVYNLNKFVNNLHIKSDNLYNVLNYKPLSINNQTDGYITNVNTGNFTFGNILTNINGRDIELPIHTNSSNIPQISCKLNDYFNNEISLNGQELQLYCYIE